ncbi:uncharacterized protein SPPG_06494 [Spizellomyces punctatus DAOM BR117]|uniref:Uncharacterized protein n=1 Tax=Spizellomyces punctatus (strain DAOM BR117) TaxID=645134 RepID=A0A0L0HBJ5_SPIPD|nr:uncharacterized protein SPPG_06494 [Spizellomyces punctatus DAOM BR117]KNC98083.1 hypothetical protein SPPG_06494 [Spizellomyces punctatus DAOM BR117]|eukprot:XP_016606123.1 hypothetical protein SPPG_06494 [Spizellomyces punctatus DAOM BR117]
MSVVARTTFWALLFAFFAVWMNGVTVTAIPAVRDIAAENNIIPCSGARAMTILPTDNNDTTTLGQLVIVNDSPPNREYTFTLTLSLPDGAVEVSPSGLVTLVTSLGKNKAVGFKAEANAVIPPVDTISQFFLIQMI